MYEITVVDLQQFTYLRFVLSIHFCSFCVNNKKNITCWLEEMNFMFLCHSNIKFISSLHCVISSLIIFHLI